MTRVKTVCILAVVSILIAAGASSTYASLLDNGSTNINAKAGSLEFTVSAASLNYGIPNLFPSETNIYPGVPIYSDVTVNNTGAAPLKYVIANSDSTTTSNALMDSVVVTVTVSGATIYNGTVKDFSTSTRTVQPGKSEIVRISYLWPENSDLIESQKYYLSRTLVIKATS